MINEKTAKFQMVLTLYGRPYKRASTAAKRLAEDTAYRLAPYRYRTEFSDPSGYQRETKRRDRILERASRRYYELCLKAGLK